MAVTYFAYGSNLCLPRMRFRVPGVTLLGPARLKGYALNWSKRGRDASAKCHVIVAHRSSVVHGALFSIPASEKLLLDRAEGLGAGYDETEVVADSVEGLVTATTYVADPGYVDGSLQPYSWYRALVVCGAESLKLPNGYVAQLKTVSAVEDPNEKRMARERSFLCNTCTGQPQRLS